MKTKIAALAVSALLLTGCAGQPLKVSYQPLGQPTANTQEIRANYEAESAKVLDFEKPHPPLKKIESKPAETFEPMTSEESAQIVTEAVAIQEAQPQPEAPAVAQPQAPTPPQPQPPVEAPAAPQEDVNPVDLGYVKASDGSFIAPEYLAEYEASIKPPAPVASNWAQDILNANGYGHITVSIGDAQGMCASAIANAVGCSAVGTSSFTLAAHLQPDAAGLHVLWHETAHAIGVLSECEAEEFAWSMTGNRGLASYQHCL